MAETQKRLVREYETTYLIKPETPDEQVDEIKERLRAVVSREGGKVIRFTNQGRRKTAFPVAKMPKALYIHCLYVGKPGLVAEFERNLKMLDVVTKFESIRVADDVDLDARQVEADVVVAPVEEERPRPEFGERSERGEESFDGPGDDRGEEEPWHVPTWVSARVPRVAAASAAASAVVAVAVAASAATATIAAIVVTAAARKVDA